MKPRAMSWSQLGVAATTAFAAVFLFAACTALAATDPSQNANILFQQLETLGTPADLGVQGGNGAGVPAYFVGQHQGDLAFIRLKMKLIDNATTTGSVYPFAASSSVVVSFAILNRSTPSACSLIRLGYFPTSWANDDQYHDFDWSPRNALYNSNANHCTITPGQTYEFAIITNYKNVDVLAATDSDGVPYTRMSVEPLDITFPPLATSTSPAIIWQSTPDHNDEISVSDPLSNPGAFNKTRFSYSVPLGIWDGPDFTTTASTTVRIWDRSAQTTSAVFDVGLAVSSGGNPYTSSPERVAHLIYGYPYNNPWIFTNAPAGTATQEQIFPTYSNITIHHGDELWGSMYPSYAATYYNGGENVFVGGSGNTPQFQICEGDCNTIPLQTATVTVPVIIIPGIMGSAKHNDEWIIDPITHAFDNLIDTLVANGYAKDENLFTFPYDWHKSNVDTAILLKQKIDGVKAQCHCDKVDLVAHSMGGLVARQYIQSNTYDHDVRNMIFIGTPHLGAPEDYLMWGGGEIDPLDQRGLEGYFLWAMAKAHHFSSVFDFVRETPIYSVRELLPVYPYINHIGSGDFSAYPNDGWYPSNPFLENLNNNVQTLLSSGVTISNFVGQRDQDRTIDHLIVQPPTTINPADKWGYGSPVFIARGPGDDVVPIASASFINQNVQSLNGNHGEIITKAEGRIFKILTDKNPISLIDVSRPTSLDVAIFQIFSPADIQIVAPDGKRIGKDFITGQEFHEIPDAFYTGYLTDEEYVTILNPINGQYKIITKGTGNGGEYTLSTAVVKEATSSETLFTGQTLPGLLTEHNVNINTENPGETSIVPVDQIPPSIIFAQPATSTYTHDYQLPVRVTFADNTGVATSSATFDSRLIAASSSIDLFYETLGTHTITASSTDLINNATSSKKIITVIATASSTISDVQREYALGMIKSKDLRDLLIKKLNTSVKLQKITDTITVSTKPLVTKKVDRWIQILDTLILKSMLVDLSLAKNLRLISDQGYQILAADINWLLSH